MGPGGARFQLAAAAGVLSISIGCGGEPRASSSGLRVDTLASGRIVVTNPDGGSWTPETAWTLEEDLRLGSVDGTGPELFSQIAAILTDSAEAIYVLDYPSQEIRVFDASGSFLRRLGGQGEGPGELLGAAGLNWGPDGNLWVWGSRHYVVLQASGEEVARYIRPARGVIYSWMGGFDGRGRYIDFGLDRETLGQDRVGPYLVPRFSGRHMVQPIAFTPPDRVDTLPLLEYYSEVTEAGDLKYGRNGFEAVVDGDDLWFTDTNDYTLYRRTVDGDTLLSATRPVRPAPVPQREIDSIMALMKEREGPSSDRVSEESFVRERLVVGNVAADGHGRVYVFPQEEGLPEGHAVDVFDSAGVLLGRMRFPHPVLTERPAAHITESHIYAVEIDELEIPFVVRYRIVRP